MEKDQFKPAGELCSSLSLLPGDQRALTIGLASLIELAKNPGDRVGFKDRGRKACQDLLIHLQRLPETAFETDSLTFLLGYKPADTAALPPQDLERLRKWHGFLSTLYAWVTESDRFASAVDEAVAGGQPERLNEAHTELSTFLIDLASFLTPLVAYWREVALQRQQP